MKARSRPNTRGSRVAAARKLSDIAIQHCDFYLPDHARYQHLLNLPEKEDIARALQKAMEAIEEYKPELQGVLPQQEYFRLARSPQNKGMAPAPVEELCHERRAGRRGMLHATFGRQAHGGDHRAARPQMGRLSWSR